MTTLLPGYDKAFRLVEFINPATGTASWRVSGKHNGKRIRENFALRTRAEARRLELDIARLGAQTTDQLRATWLSTQQLRAAESIFARHPDVDGVLKAFKWWEGVGAAQEAATAHAKDLTLDQAEQQFQKWLETTPTLRDASKRDLRSRVRLFASEVGDIALGAITPEVIEAWLAKRKVSAVSRSNDKRAVSRFFSWCIERPQRFLSHNPAVGVKVELPEAGQPEIFTLDEVGSLLKAAREFREGRFLKGIVLQLFGGMRPTEASRFHDDWFKDGQLTIPAHHTKTGRARTFAADPLLKAWLKVCSEGPVADPQGDRRLWNQMRTKARLDRWIHDGLRHTAISHFFRRSGSYGLTAEWAGNSEAVIKAHYQGRVSVAEATKFWQLFPNRPERKQPAEERREQIRTSTA